MLRNPHRWLRALWLLALLWQAAAAPAAALMGCCEQALPCCLTQAMPPACTACAACAPLAVPVSLTGAQGLPSPEQTQPGYSDPPVIEALPDAIWRPPARALRP